MFGTHIYGLNVSAQWYSMPSNLKKEEKKPKRWRTDKTKKKQMFSQIRLRWLRAID